MKKIFALFIILFSVNLYAITGYTIPYPPHSHDTIVSWKSDSNWQAGANWSNKLIDTLNGKFIRYTTIEGGDSTLSLLNVDTIKSAPFIDTILSNKITSADSMKGINTKFTRGAIDTITAKKITSADSVKGINIKTTGLNASGNGYFGGNLSVSGNDSIGGNLNIAGNDTVGGNSYVDGKLTVQGNITGDTIKGDIDATYLLGDTIAANKITSADSIKANKIKTASFNASADGYFGGNLKVIGNDSISSNVFIDEKLDVNGNITSNFNISGDTLKGIIDATYLLSDTITANKITSVDSVKAVNVKATNVNATKVTTSGNDSVGGNLIVAGNDTIGGNSYIDGKLTVNGNIESNDSIKATDVVSIIGNDDRNNFINGSDTMPYLNKTLLRLRNTFIWNDSEYTSDYKSSSSINFYNAKDTCTAALQVENYQDSTLLEANSMNPVFSIQLRHDADKIFYKDFSIDEYGCSIIPDLNITGKLTCNKAIIQDSITVNSDSMGSIQFTQGLLRVGAYNGIIGVSNQCYIHSTNGNYPINMIISSDTIMKLKYSDPKIIMYGNDSTTGNVKAGGNIIATGDIYTTPLTDISNTVTYDGWDGDFWITKSVKYRKQGKDVYLYFNLEDTSAATYAYVLSLPDTAETTTKFVSRDLYGMDNTTTATSLIAYIAQNTNVLVLSNTLAFGNFGNSWTAGGVKQAVGQIHYIAKH